MGRGMFWLSFNSVFIAGNRRPCVPLILQDIAFIPKSFVTAQDVSRALLYSAEAQLSDQLT